MFFRIEDSFVGKFIRNEDSFVPFFIKDYICYIYLSQEYSLEMKIVYLFLSLPKIMYATFICFRKFIRNKDSFVCSFLYQRLHMLHLFVSGNFFRIEDSFVCSFTYKMLSLLVVWCRIEIRPYIFPNTT